MSKTSKKNNKPKIVKKNTLKNRIHKYFSKKQDICCDEDIERKIVIEQILKIYTEIANTDRDNYLDYVDNDILVFIGYRMNLEEKKDFDGLNLWDEIASKTSNKGVPNKEKIIKLLQELPLYYLLSFLGYAYYKCETNKELFKK